MPPKREIQVRFLSAGPETRTKRHPETPEAPEKLGASIGRSVSRGGIGHASNRSMPPPRIPGRLTHRTLRLAGQAFVRVSFLARIRSRK